MRTKHRTATCDAPDTMRHSTKSTGQSTQARPSGSIATAFVQERSVGRGAGGWSLGIPKAFPPEMDIFVVVDRFVNPKTAD